MFLRDELAMSAENRVGLHERRQLHESLAAELLALHGKSTTLIVGQWKAACSSDRLIGFDFFAKEVDRLVVPLVEPRCESRNQERQRCHDFFHAAHLTPTR